mgnify:CR=1 FL=1|tara:strand:- start:24092 stop:25219 length:1128 start_codon:yes stop_codon:yes gene_type:complete
MKKINLKKSNILEGLGKTKKIHETYGSTPQEIMVSEEQLTRLMEKQYNEQLTPPVDTEVGDSEDYYTDMTVTNEEDIFDDYRHEHRPSHDKSGGGHRPSYEKGEFTPGYTEDQSAEGFDEDEIGAYLNMNKLKDYELGEAKNSKPDFLDLDKDGDKKEPMKKAAKEVNEDSEGEETYNYGEDEGQDEYRLKHDDMSSGHRKNLKKDMAYDEDHEDRGEYGTHFESLDNLYKKSQLEQLDLMVMETFDSINRSIIRERIRGLKRTDYILNEQSEWSGGRNPGESAASGIENVVSSLKKAWNFIKDEKTRHQIMNTLTKLDNFMKYSAELVASGRDQKGPRGYGDVTNPLPYPELEDNRMDIVDDEIDIMEEDLELE